MAKEKKVKRDAAAWVPQTAEEANAAIERIGRCQRYRERLAARMNDKLAETKAKYEEAAAPFKAEIETLSSGLQTWCEAHRGALTLEGKRKFYRFAAGEVAWRMRPPSIVLRKIADVIAAIKERKLGNVFIRVKEEVDKEAMLKNPALAGSIAGVKVAQGEDFVIKPFETELEEVRQ